MQSCSGVDRLTVIAAFGRHGTSPLPQNDPRARRPAPRPHIARGRPGL